MSAKIKENSRLRKDIQRFALSTKTVKDALEISDKEYQHLFFEVGMVTVDRLLYHLYKGKIPQDIRTEWLYNKNYGYWAWWKNKWFAEQEEFLESLKRPQDQIIIDDYTPWMENLETEELIISWMSRLDKRGLVWEKKK